MDTSPNTEKISNWICFHVANPLVFGSTQLMIRLDTYVQLLAAESTWVGDMIVPIEACFSDYREIVADYNLASYSCETYLITLPTQKESHHIGFSVKGSGRQLFVKKKYADLIRAWLEVSGNEFTEVEPTSRSEANE